ncbi:hypothetical protein F0919_02430 [Taibaiella lutea]|uniref:Uncharacterized protein n=1 Tax=Taibaiella lutea TaxID=2608001 RepID=A0A5M6CN28_9BACT|nr:hypothetical protein [Taibaiella lutea]KAA5536544.1 hypothetical protein F0919_02430 [Taibaiella lutea]
MKNLILIATILFCSCSSLFIQGKYASKENNNYFDFKKDSTFTYEYRLFHTYRYSSGTWSLLKNNRILLKSSYLDSIVLLEVNETEQATKKKTSLNIDFNIINGLTPQNYYCQMYIDDKPYFKDDVLMGKRCDSLKKVEIADKIDSLYFVIYREPIHFVTTATSFPISTGKYYPQKGYSDMNIRISFNDSLFYYKIFNNEPLLISKGRIKLFNRATGKWEVVNKVSDSLNIMANPKIR